MARCEVCGGHIRTQGSPTHDRDPGLVVTDMEFHDECSWARGKKTHFCTPECAIEGIQEGLLLSPDDVTLYSMRHGLDDEPDPGPLLQRAQELLADAREQLDERPEEYVGTALGSIESARVLLEGPEVLEDA